MFSLLQQFHPRKPKTKTFYENENVSVLSVRNVDLLRHSHETKMNTDVTKPGNARSRASQFESFDFCYVRAAGFFAA